MEHALSALPLRPGPCREVNAYFLPACSCCGDEDGAREPPHAAFDYFHDDYAGDQTFEHYNTERLRAADTLVLGGRTSFLGTKDYWTSVPTDPNATAIRREFAELIQRVDKVVVSDKITSEE